MPRLSKHGGEAYVCTLLQAQHDILQVIYSTYNRPLKGFPTYTLSIFQTFF